MRWLFMVLLLVAPVAGQSGGGAVSEEMHGPHFCTGSPSPVVVDTPRTEWFRISMQDANGEGDIASVQMFFTDPDGIERHQSPIFTAPWTVVPPGWEFTDDVPHNGVLQANYTHTWMPDDKPGTWSMYANVVGYGPAPGTGARVASTVSADCGLTEVIPGAIIEAFDCTFDSAGNAESDCVWGGWSVDPGDTAVQSLNYLKVQNTGGASGDAAVAFTLAEFRGVDGTNSGASIPIDGNIVFRSGAGASPATATLVSGAVDADGTFLVSVDAGQTVWIGYEIVAVPDVILPGSYQSPYSFG
jgi:hypothetical protein